MRVKCPKCGVTHQHFEDHVCAKPPRREMGVATISNHVGPVTTSVAKPDPGVEVSNTYKYRDPDKRRKQVAEAMKRYRARKKAKRDG